MGSTIDNSQQSTEGGLTNISVNYITSVKLNVTTPTPYTFGSSGAGNGQFNSPNAIALDNQGNVYVVDSGNDRVEKFNSSGQYLLTIGQGWGRGNGQLGYSTGIATDKNGNVYVVDQNNSIIQKFNSSGVFLSQFGGSGSAGGQFKNPNGIAFDSNGNIYVVDTDNNRVEKFNSSGQYLSQFGSFGDTPGLFDKAMGITIDSNNNIYVINNGNDRIEKFDSSGKYLSTLNQGWGSGQGQLGYSTGIALDSSGNIYVVDTGNNLIEKFNSSGQYLSQLNGSNSTSGLFKSPKSIAIDGSNDIYVADTGNNHVQVFPISIKAPTATNDTYNTTENQTLIVPLATGILANDTDPNGKTLTTSLVNKPIHGTLNLSSSGSFNYIPNTGYTGTDSFTYTANDAISNSNTATVTLNINPAPSSYIVGAYYPNYATYAINYQVANIPANKINHLLYAFAQTDAKGNVTSTDTWADTDQTFNGKYTQAQSQSHQAGNFAELRALKATNPNLVSMISIGGWTLSNHFSAVASTDSSRKTFAASAISFMLKNGFDGIDIDWEFPVSGGLTAGTRQDKHNFTLLLDELHKELSALPGKHYQLSVAVSPNFQDIVKDYEPALIAKDVDFFNVMNYNYYDSWSTTTDNQAPLYADPKDPTYYKTQLNINYTIQQYIKAGVPASKLVMGDPAYGNTWAGVAPGPNNDGLFQSATGGGPGDHNYGGPTSNVFTYAELYNKINDPTSGYKAYWDSAAQVPYIYNSSLKVFSTYENSQSITAKTNYIKNQGLAGMFFWDASSDLPASNSNSLINVASSQLPH